MRSAGLHRRAWKRSTDSRWRICAGKWRYDFCGGFTTECQPFFRTIGIETNQVRNTMIIGGGKISFYLAKRLLEMGIQVKIVEKDRAACERLCEQLPKAMIINGDGTDRDLLAEEGLASAEGFAALTNMDEENVMLSLYAKSMSKAKKITKINRNTFDTIIGSLGIGSLIYPKHITSETILQYVRAMQNSIGSNVETLYRLVDGNAEALEFIICGESEVTDIPLQELISKRIRWFAQLIEKAGSSFRKVRIVFRWGILSSLLRQIAEHLKMSGIF